MDDHGSVSGRKIAVHVIDANRLSADALRSILKTDFPKLTLHSNLPRALSGGTPVLIVNTGTAGTPLRELLRNARSRHPQAAVILLDGRSARESFVELLSLGVTGFVPSSRAREELCAAVRCVAQGRVWMASEVMREFEQQKRLPAKPRPDGLTGVSGPMKLTTREAAVLPLLEHGLCNKEIAAALKISVPTVKFHVRNIFTKAGARDRQEVLALAKRNGRPYPGKAISPPADGVRR